MSRRPDKSAWPSPKGCSRCCRCRLLSIHRSLSEQTPTRSPDWSAPRNPQERRSVRCRSSCRRPGKCASRIPRARIQCGRSNLLAGQKSLSEQTPTRLPDRRGPRNPPGCRWARRRSMCHRLGKCGSLIPRACSRCCRNRLRLNRGSFPTRRPSRCLDLSVQDSSVRSRCSTHRCPQCRPFRRCRYRHPNQRLAHPAESQARLEPRHHCCRCCRPCCCYWCQPRQPRCYLHCRPCRRRWCQPRQPRYHPCCCYCCRRRRPHCRPCRCYCCRRRQPHCHLQRYCHPRRCAMLDTYSPRPSRRSGASPRLIFCASRFPWWTERSRG